MRRYDFHIRQGDRLPVISGRLRDATGAAVVLDEEPDAAVFSMRHEVSKALVIDRAPITFDHETGDWSYAWQDGDTARAGEHLGEVELVVNGRAQTFPSSKQDGIWIYISEQIG